MALDYLTNPHARPRHKARTTALSGGNRGPKRLLPGADVAGQAVGGQQERLGESARFDFLGQAINEGLVATYRQHSAQPQPGGHLDRHRHPNHDFVRQLDPDLIGLAMNQIARLLDHGLMHVLAMPTGLVLPGKHGAFIQTESHDDGLNRAAIGEPA